MRRGEAAWRRAGRQRRLLRCATGANRQCPCTPSAVSSVTRAWGGTGGGKRPKWHDQTALYRAQPYRAQPCWTQPYRAHAEGTCSRAHKVRWIQRSTSAAACRGVSFIAVAALGSAPFVSSFSTTSYCHVGVRRTPVSAFGWQSGRVSAEAQFAQAQPTWLFAAATCSALGTTFDSPSLLPALCALICSVMCCLTCDWN